MKLDGKKAGYVLLRLALGAVFVLYGVNKFQAGVGATIDQMARQFDRTFLPSLAVKAFAGALPSVEVVVGLLVLTGLFTRVALVLAGLELIALCAGLAVLGNAATVATNLLFLLVVYVLLSHEEDNAFSLDAARKTP
jgi:thiosulfate dehydrogenase (quinone) large subunit